MEKVEAGRSCSVIGEALTEIACIHSWAVDFELNSLSQPDRFILTNSMLWPPQTLDSSCPPLHRAASAPLRQAPPSHVLPRNHPQRDSRRSATIARLSSAGSIAITGSNIAYVARWSLTLPLFSPFLEGQASRAYKTHEPAAEDGTRMIAHVPGLRGCKSKRKRT